MKIEIWSDVVCPFCYIGKRHLEIALRDAQLIDQVEVEWKSFQLDPNADAYVGQHLHDYLAESKGMSREQAAELSAQVAERGAAVGIDFNFDQAIVANTRLAHHLLHLAKKEGEGNAYVMKERLFKAYFTEGMNLNEKSTLLSLGKEMGLEERTMLSYLDSAEADEAFHSDLSVARQFGIRGVPFFVFNRKYAVSGAQPVQSFIDVLRKVAEEENAAPEIIGNGSTEGSCSIDDAQC